MWNTLCLQNKVKGLQFLTLGLGYNIAKNINARKIDKIFWYSISYYTLVKKEAFASQPVLSLCENIQPYLCV